MVNSLAVIGAGAWGTALAKLLAQKGYPLSLWAYDPGLAEAIDRLRQNKTYLPGVKLPKGVRPTSSLREAISGKDLVVLVTPSHALRTVATEAAPFFKSGVRLVIATKGLESDSLKRMSEVIGESLPGQVAQNLAVLSGPSFAKEVARGVPTAVAMASEKAWLARQLQEVFSTSYLRVYTTQDMVGVELGGALKNVIAIAAGTCAGLRLGYNSQAALITRGIAEMTRLAVKLGANPLTLAGLSGLGDLVLTATSSLSRNRTLGLKLGQGYKLEDILGQTKAVAEGMNTAKAVHLLSKRLGVEMPISEQVYAILHQGVSPKETLSALMNRDLKGELEFDTGHSL